MTYVTKKLRSYRKGTRKYRDKKEFYCIVCKSSFWGTDIKKRKDICTECEQNMRVKKHPEYILN